MMVRRFVALAATVTLSLPGCTTALPSAGVVTATGAGAPALATALVRLSAASQVPLKGTFATKGVSFSDPGVAYLRFTAAGVGFAPITADYAWTPGSALPAIGVAVPIGTNRIFTLSAMNAYKNVLVSLKGVASVAAGSNAVTIDWSTTPTAAVLEDLVINDPAVAAQVNLAQLQALVNGITGYDAPSGSFTKTPAQVDSGAIAARVITNAGIVPADDPAFYAMGVGTVNVQVQDASSNPVASGVRLQINDLTSAPVGSTTANPTAIGNVALGRWQVTATHATLGSGTAHFTIGATGGMTPTVTVTLGAAAVMPSGDVGTVQTLYHGERTHVDGAATAAVLAYPGGVAVVGTKAYVTERNYIRCVDLTTGAVTTLAGDGTYGDVDATGPAARFKKAAGIVADPTGTYLYVADSDASRIKRVTIATGQVVTVAGSGTDGHVNATGTSAAFYGPVGVAIAPDASYLVVSDIWNSRLRKVTLPGGAVSDLAGDGNWGAADGGPGVGTVGGPSAVAIDPAGQYAYFCDRSQRLRKVLLDPGLGTVGTLTSLTTGGAGTYAEGAAAAATFAWDDNSSTMDWGRHTGLAVSADGATLYVSDTRNNRIRQVDAATGTASLLAGSGRTSLIEDTGAAAAMTRPAGLARDGAGNLVFVDAGNFRLRRLNVTTGATGFIAGSGATSFAEGILGSGAYLGEGSGVAYDPSRNRLYVADRVGNRILAYDPLTRNLTTLAGSGERGSADGPAASASFDFDFRTTALVYDAVRDRLYVSSGERVCAVTLAGPVTVTSLVASGVGPRGLAIDAAAAFLYIGTTAGTVRKFDLATSALVGTLVTGTGANFGSPNALVVKGNDLYVAGERNGQFWKVDLTTETAAVVAGTGTAGFQDGTGTAAQIGYVIGATLDPSGSQIYLSDYWHHDPVYAIRRYRIADGVISSLMRKPAGTVDGPLTTAASYGGARSLAFDTLGTTMYFLDNGSGSLRKLVFQ